MVGASATNARGATPRASRRAERGLSGPRPARWRLCHRHRSILLALRLRERSRDANRSNRRIAVMWGRTLGRSDAPRVARRKERPGGVGTWKCRWTGLSRSRPFAASVRLLARGAAERRRWCPRDHRRGESGGSRHRTRSRRLPVVAFMRKGRDRSAVAAPPGFFSWRPDRRSEPTPGSHRSRSLSPVLVTQAEQRSDPNARRRAREVHCFGLTPLLETRAEARSSRASCGGPAPGRPRAPR